MEPPGAQPPCSWRHCGETGVTNFSDWDGDFQRWWRALRARLVAPFPPGTHEPHGPRSPRWVRLPSLLGSSALVWLALLLALLVLSMWVLD